MSEAQQPGATLRKLSWKQKPRANTTEATGSADASADPEAAQLSRRAVTLYEMYDPVEIDGHRLVGESVNAYNLKWANLRTWLVARYKEYPKLTFNQNNGGIKDRFFFKVPENDKLTAADKDEIDKLREVSETRSKQWLQDKQRHSPERETMSDNEA